METENTPISERIPFQAMTQGPFASLLRVPGEGFSWREGLVSFEKDPVGQNVAGSWLVRQDSRYFRQYSPLDVPDLHRRFASTDPTADSILDFANEYGFLGHAQWLAKRSPEQQPMLVGEPLTFWQKEIDHLEWLIDLWELVENERRRELSQLVYWTPLGEPQQVELYIVSVAGKLRPDLAQIRRQNRLEFRKNVPNDSGLTHGKWELLVQEESGIGVELLEHWKHGDPIEPARYFVHREVNNHQKGHVSPAVLPFRKGEIFFFPDCLLSSLYTKFMLELSGRDRPAVLCERPNCGRYFEPLHGRQKYCEKRCQQLAYYYRKKGKVRTN